MFPKSYSKCLNHESMAHESESNHELIFLERREHDRLAQNHLNQHRTESELNHIRAAGIKV